MFRPRRLPEVIRRPAALFDAEPVLEWIERGRIIEVVQRYDRAVVLPRVNSPRLVRALCASCNLAVVRAVVLHRFGFASVTLEDRTLDTRPMYVKVRWSGQLVDLAPPEGIAAAGSPRVA